jgi:hypothetical protein
VTADAPERVVFWIRRPKSLGSRAQQDDEAIIGA